MTVILTYLVRITARCVREYGNIDQHRTSSYAHLVKFESFLLLWLIWQEFSHLAIWLKWCNFSHTVSYDWVIVRAVIRARSREGRWWLKRNEKSHPYWNDSNLRNTVIPKNDWIPTKWVIIAQMTQFYQFSHTNFFDVGQYYSRTHITRVHTWQ